MTNGDRPRRDTITAVCWLIKCSDDEVNSIDFKAQESLLMQQSYILEQLQSKSLCFNFEQEKA